MASIKNNYIFQLAGDLPSSGTSVAISVDLERSNTVTFTNAYVVLRSGNKIERIKATAAAGTMTISKRGLDETDTDVEVTGLKKDWKEGTTCYVTVLASQLQDVLDIIASGALLPPSYADDTARDAAITSPENGMIVYNEADGFLNKYVGGTWVDDEGGAVVADASETVAGKLEEGTQAESDAGTSVGGTGAKLALTPLKSGRSAQANAWIKGSDAGGDDTYVLTLTPAPTAYSDGMEVLLKPTTANTGACTIDVNSLGVKNIKTLSGVDPSNGDIPTTRYTRLRYNGTEFVIVDDTQSTTTNNGANKIALDATAVTGTDEVLTINSKQLSTLSNVVMKAGYTASIGFAASSTTSITGLGLNKAPSLIKLCSVASEGVKSYPMIWDNGVYVGWTCEVTTSGSQTLNTSTAHMVKRHSASSGDYSTLTIANVTSSGFDIVVTNSGGTVSGNGGFNGGVLQYEVYQ